MTIQWTPRNKIKWNLNKNTDIFFLEIYSKCRLQNDGHFTQAAMCQNKPYHQCDTIVENTIIEIDWFSYDAAKVISARSISSDRLTS